jgi:acetate kinase
MAILAVNAGSSSLKFSLHPLQGGQVQPHALGQHPGAGARWRAGHGVDLSGQKAPGSTGGARRHRPFVAALDSLRALVQKLEAAPDIEAVAHRVVHGGGVFTSVLVTEEVLERLACFNSLAPLHQPHNLEGMRRFQAAFPQLPQVACFDTAFHATMPEVDYAFALPKALQEEGVRRYGFHGLSYQYIMGMLLEHTLRGRGRVVMAHLGNGASLCAALAGSAWPPPWAFRPWTA